MSRHIAMGFAVAAALFGSRSAWAQALVPGTGQPVADAGDDFEDLDWRYVLNEPKSSQDVDGKARTPGGRSANGRWQESKGRGQPDVVERVETPPDGLE